MSLVIKKCTLADLDTLVQIARKTFVDAFEKQNNPTDFKKYIDDAFNKGRIKDELNTKNSSFYFGYQDKQLVGYFKLNQEEAQTDIKNAATIELERIYVLEQYQGRRFGEQLLKEAIRIGRAANKNFIWLGVWEHNNDAIRFYQKQGFVKFGTHPYFVGNDEQTDWLLRYDLSNFQHSS